MGKAIEWKHPDTVTGGDTIRGRLPLHGEGDRMETGIPTQRLLTHVPACFLFMGKAIEWKLEWKLRCWGEFYPPLAGDARIARRSDRPRLSH